MEKKIEKNIPVFNHANRKYDFAAMGIGDAQELESPKLRYAVFSAVRWYNEKNKTNIRITTRKRDGVVWFWRIS